MKLLVALSVIVLFASSLAAQEEEEAPIELEEIVTIGTRVPERSRLDSPVPVDVINGSGFGRTKSERRDILKSGACYRHWHRRSTFLVLQSAMEQMRSVPRHLGAWDPIRCLCSSTGNGGTGAR